MHDAPVDLDPDRVRCGTRGDLVIELRVSPEHEQWKQYETARSLRLTSRGDQALGFASDHAFVGRAAKYPHLFSTRDLGQVAVLPSHSRTAVPPHRRTHAQRLREDAYFFAWTRLMRAVEYPSEASDISGNFFKLPYDEYVQVEVDPEGAVVLWSSNSSLIDAFSEAGKTLGAPAEADWGYVVLLDGSTAEASSQEVWQIAQKSAASVALCVIGYPEESFSWRSPRIKLQDGQRSLAECSLAGAAISLSHLERLCSQTATEYARTALAESLVPVATALGSSAVD